MITQQYTILYALIRQSNAFQYNWSAIQFTCVDDIDLYMYVYLGVFNILFYSPGCHCFGLTCTLKVSLVVSVHLKFSSLYSKQLRLLQFLVACDLNEEKHAFAAFPLHLQPFNQMG